MAFITYFIKGEVYSKKKRTTRKATLRLQAKVAQILLFFFFDNTRL